MQRFCGDKVLEQFRQEFQAELTIGFGNLLGLLVWHQE